MGKIKKQINPYLHWWKQSPFVDFENIHFAYNPRAEAKFWYEYFWKHHRLAAWLYELIRHHAKHVPADALNDPSIRAMPPYISLDERQKGILIKLVNM